MPTVPTPTVPTVGATDFTGQRMNAPQMRNFAPEQAQQAGKLQKGFRLNPRFTDNSPQRLEAIGARHARLFPEYPLGTDFTGEEQDLLRALNWLKSKFKLSEMLELGKAALDAPEPERFPRHLERMELLKPQGFKEELYQRLLLAGLQATVRGTAQP